MKKTSLKTAIIIGAGPAGLTAAYELLKRTDIVPVILEKHHTVGGISRTIKVGENRMDIGGHRFFSKSDRVIDWWLNILPLESQVDDVEIMYQNKKKTVLDKTENNKNKRKGVGEGEHDKMLIRPRLSRIYYEGNFYDYPISLSFATFKNLGIVKLIKIGITYIKSVLFPIKKEKNLEDFFINRFGKELYLTFFKSYTEKVWGRACTDIESDWGKQRIKGLSIMKAIKNALMKPFRKMRGVSLRQKNTETSLIEHFMYPVHGPGHMWERVAKEIEAKGGKIIMNASVKDFAYEGNKITQVGYVDVSSGKEENLQGQYFFSTMPIRDIAAHMPFSKDVKDAAKQLEYRDFITVGLLVNKSDIPDVHDNWIYIHDPQVKVGRIQFFHNWSERMVGEKEHAFLGLEYFCDKGDEMWTLSDKEMIDKAVSELKHIKLLRGDTVLLAHVERVEKAYPVYAGSYSQFEKIKSEFDIIPNIFPIGRNGMHKYNNQDHSMLAAMEAVDLIVNNSGEKDRLWNINTEESYHEEK